MIGIAILVILSLQVILCDSWTGSKLGTKAYNQELNVVKQGAEDYIDLKLEHSRNPPKPLLCVTFSSSSINTTVLPKNIYLMSTDCEWAVIFYDDNEKQISKRCNELFSWEQVIHCRMFPKDRRLNITSASTTPMSIPKTVLYTELLPYLSEYKRVFLMDEDISLIGFNYSTFASVWDCSFNVPPLIVQPLIAESNQWIPYVNAKPWQNQKNILSSAVGLVEQQVPLFDAIFFEWFVRRVLVNTYSLALKYGVDWGHDRSWCYAAKLYSKEVLKRPENSTVVCAVLPGGTFVHHLNGHTMNGKRLNREMFHRNGVLVVQHYINMFPTWVLTDVRMMTNPLISQNKGMYQRVSTLNQTCVESKNRL